MKTNIALIGFMGAGKTAVGELLAERLGKKPVETDRLIEKRAGKSIPDIFSQDGEAAFRQLEVDVIGEVAGDKNQVIACGGGVVLNHINTDRLKEGAVVVYLTAPPEVILRRVLADTSVRPLLKSKNKEQTVRKLMRCRRPLYERAADIEIDTSELDIDEVAEHIIARL
ncbi:MAG TPA: shikimate kinase [Dehalococcoidia bacterium]|nr:shikimate kinase [Dehalococcoidia bacterium]